MSSKSLCIQVRTAAIAMAVCGLTVCGYILPKIGSHIAHANPELAHAYYPWLFFLWAAALPCFAVLALVWRVSTAIRQDQVFALRTARWVKFSSWLLLGDVGFFFAGNILLLLLNMSHPGVVLVSLFIDVLGVALAVSAAALARYLTKAAALQEEADATI